MCPLERRSVCSFCSGDSAVLLVIPCHLLKAGSNRSRRYRFQSLSFSMGPSIDLLALCGRELCICMNKCVSGRRHLVAPDDSPYASKDIPLFVQPIFIPPGEIHVASGLAYVAFHQPGHRCDVAIPRPFGSVGMTILARPLDYA